MPVSLRLFTDLLQISQERVNFLLDLEAPIANIAGLANPTALLLSSVMMLRHMALHEEAVRVENAIFATLAEGKVTTGDLGGKSSTSEYTDAIIRHL